MSPSADDQPSPSLDRRSPSALLKCWVENQDSDSLDLLLRQEILALKDALRARAAHLLTGSAGASDIAQEAVLGLLQVDEVPRFEDPRQLRAYLWTSAWRLLVARLDRASHRHRRVQLDAVDLNRGEFATTGGMSAVDREDRARALEVALNLLGPGHAEILRLVYLEGRTIADAAAQIGVSTETANMRLVRARRAFARKLAEWAQLIG